MRIRAALFTAGWLAGGLPALAAEPGPEQPEPRATMHQIFEAVVYLLPASLDEQRFADPAQREAIKTQILLLSTSADTLQAHARERDAGFQYLSRSLTRDVTEIRRRYGLGRYEEARYYLSEFTQNCVACHSRLPSAREFPLAERLTDRIEVASLSAGERAQVYVATRNFDKALSTWEGIFTDPAVEPAEMDIQGYLADYLTVAVRVQRDFKRPRRTLRKLAGRPDLPRYLRAHVEIWIRALGELKGELDEEPSIERARKLVEAASAMSDFPAGRGRLVHDLVASSILLRYIDAAKRPNPALAEAFYLLGLIETRTLENYWVPQAEAHLEAAVRVDPKSSFAEKAYALLEEYTLLGYGGSAGVLLPEDVEENLAELRALLDAP